MKILVVDDERLLRKTLCRELEKNGFIAESVETAEKALDRIESDRFELVITDNKLPDMSGVEFLKEIREHKAESMKVIVITAYISSENRRKFEDLGANAYLQKPFDLEQIVKLVKSQI